MANTPTDTEAATPEQRADIERLAAAKPLWEYGGDCCAGCLPNGEPADEEPSMTWAYVEGSDDNERVQLIGLCYNCMDTCFEIHAGYASRVIYGPHCTGSTL